MTTVCYAPLLIKGASKEVFPRSTHKQAPLNGNQQTVSSHHTSQQADVIERNLDLQHQHLNAPVQSNLSKEHLNGF